MLVFIILIWALFSAGFGGSSMGGGYTQSPGGFSATQGEKKMVRRTYPPETDQGCHLLLFAFPLIEQSCAVPHLLAYLSSGSLVTMNLYIPLVFCVSQAAYSYMKLWYLAQNCKGG